MFVSGMTFTSRYCESVFSTPLRAFAPLTVSYGDGSTSVVYQEYYGSSQGSGLVLASSVNYTTLSTGLAVAAPIYVGWQAKDLPLFPLAYATSLAKQFNIPFTPGPTPGTSSSLPKQTNTSQSVGLSTGAKAGIGVGAVLGAACVIGVLFLLLCLARRRRRRRITVGTPGNELPEMIDQNKHREGSDT